MPMYNCKIWLALVLIFTQGTWSIEAHSMSIEPLVIDMISMGEGSRRSFKVSNNGVSALPLEINVSRMELGPDGDARYEPADGDFLIYPSQANIPKGGAQSFRIQWLGDPNIKSSRNYRFSVSQVPLKQVEGTSGVQIVMSFGVVVSVSSPQSKAALIAIKAGLAKDKNGKGVVALLVRNPADKHAYLRDATVSLSGRGWSAKLTSQELGQKLGLGIVQPGKERRFLLPVEVPGNVSDITASIDYQPEK